MRYFIITCKDAQEIKNKTALTLALYITKILSSYQLNAE